MLSKIRSYFLRVVFFTIVVLVGIMLTGAVERNYEVLNQGSQLEVGGTYLDLQTIADHYLLPIVIPQGINKEDLDRIFYEVVDENSRFTINYYFKWKSEHHPDPLQHLIQTAWKYIYFKFNDFDIEYLQVDVDKKTGNVLWVKFENGLIASQSPMPSLQINGWKHNFQIGNTRGKSKYFLDQKPVYFESNDYKLLKMTRRSQGDYRTDENRSNLPIIIFLELLATFYFRHVQKDYDNEYAH